jgi:excisionase family DNA binding protein
MRRVSSSPKNRHPSNHAIASLPTAAAPLRTPPLTTTEVANHLGVSEDVARELFRSEKLHAAKIGGQWRVQPESLAEYVMQTFEKH